MPLSGNDLGTALYNARNAFNNKDINELIMIYGDIEGVRLAMAQVDGNTIVNYFKANTKLTVPGVGLIAPNGAVSGTSTTGTIS